MFLKKIKINVYLKCRVFLKGDYGMKPVMIMVCSALMVGLVGCQDMRGRDVGTVAGAGVGALAGAAIGGSGTQAVVGATAGAVAGGVAGHYIGKTAEKH